MSTLRLLIALVVSASAGLGSAQAAASWSFGASNPSSVSSSGASAGSGRVAGWNLKENVKRTTEPPAEAVEQNVKSPRDPASGQATGKRLHKPLSTGVSSQ